MGSYKRKDGTVVVTTTVQDKAMNKRGLSKLVHVIPARPTHKSPAFAKVLASFLGEDFIVALREKAGREGNEEDT